jgi:hypothetical protein
MSTVKPLKLCRKCGKNYCLSGYCSFCRDKDATARTIAAREVMDRKEEVTPMKIVQKHTAAIVFEPGEYKGVVEATIQVNLDRGFQIEDITIDNGKVCVMLEKPFER